ncbi:MAG: DUF1801 domain-containing protein [Calditrichaceae bacterium]
MKNRSKHNGKQTIRPEDILAEHSPEVRALAESMRKMIIKIVPSAMEVAYPVWHGIGYRHPESGYFCGIFPRKDRVKLGFEFGALLPDPDSLLEGTGRQVRYVNIKSINDIRHEAIRKLLLAAIRLPASREVKMGLIGASAKPVQKK